MALTKITPQMFDTSATAHDLNVDNGTFVVDGSASRVGIGTPTPSTLLDVNGVLTATSIAGTLTTAAQTNITSLGTLTGLTSSGSIQTTGSTTRFISNSSSSGDYIRIYAGSGTGKWDIYGNGANLRFSDNDSAGIVAFDTAATFGGNVTATTFTGTLSTAAQTNITSVGTLSSLTVSGNSQLGSVDIYDNGALGVVAADTGHDLELRGRSSQAVNIVSGGTTTAVFDANGNVGIGEPNPGQKLQVAGNIQIENTGNPNLTVKSTGAGNNPLVRIRADSNYWDIQSLFSNTYNELDFRYNGSSKMIIDNQGRVGIGQPSPSAGLHVLTDLNPVMKLDRGSANNANANWYYNGTFTGQISAANADFQISAVGSSTPMSFYTNGAANMQITSAGQVLMQDGSASAPSLGFLNDTDTGIIRVTTNALGLVAAGSRKFYVNATNAYFQNLTQMQIDGGNFFVDGVSGFNTTPSSTYPLKVLQNSSLTHAAHFQVNGGSAIGLEINATCLLYPSPSPRD